MRLDPAETDRAGLEALAATVARPVGRILVVTDFDGTLAEINADPLAARPVPGALRALRRLARIGTDRPARLAIAVLTGRAVADIAGRVRVGGVRYLGNHGLETGWLSRGQRAERIVTTGSRDDPNAPSARLGRAVGAALGRPDWLFVEVKGDSVAFHYRQAPDAAEAFGLIDAAVHRALAEGVGDGPDGPSLERFDGRLIVELRPIGAGGKGAAVGRLLAELEPVSVLVLGDDRSDAEGFRLLRSERTAGHLAALTIGVHDRLATPADVIEAADAMLPAPRDAGRLLAALATILAAEVDPPV